MKDGGGTQSLKLTDERSTIASLTGPIKYLMVSYFDLAGCFKGGGKF